MKTSIWTRLIITALAGSTVAVLAAPAWGQGGEDITLRRDGSKAEPFVANLGTESAPTTAASADGFDWGDAAIGAGLGVAAALLVVGGAYTVRRRPSFGS